MAHVDDGFGAGRSGAVAVAAGRAPAGGHGGGHARLLDVGPLDEPERDAAVQLLARAFRDNPLNTAVVGGRARRRLRANRAGTRAALESARGLALVLGARRAGALVGVLVAQPPGVHPLPLPGVATQLRVLAAQGLRTARRWARVHFELERVHPREPHWYLDMVGVEPDAQRRGVGRALLDAFLARVDADGAPSYLETDRRENLALYARAAYRVVGEERVLGVPVFRLWRRPGGA